MNPAELTALIEQLAAPAQEMRDKARADLVAAGDAAVAALVAALEHAERDVRAGACLALGELGADAAADALIRVASADPDQTVRPLALGALVGIAGPDKDTVRDALLGLVRSSEDMFVRAQACTGLGRVGDTASLQALNAALQDPEQWVREAAVKALGQAASTEQDAPPQSASERLPVKAADAQPQVSGASALAKGLMSLKPEVQQWARQTLLEKGPSTIPALVPVLLGGPAEARREAAQVLGALGAAEGMIHLRRMLEQDQQMTDTLRATALHAMAAILNSAGPLEQFPAMLALDLLVEEDNDRYVRGAAAAALVAAGQANRHRAVELLVQEQRQWVVLQAAKVLAQVAGPTDILLVPQLAAMLARATDTEAQVCLLVALGRVLEQPCEEGQQLVGSLGHWLTQGAPQVRWAAALVIGATALQVDRAMLQQLLHLVAADPWEGRQLMRAVGRLALPGDPLPVETLRKVALGPDPTVAAEAVQALGALGGRAAVDVLVSLANSRAGPVVAAAAQALSVQHTRASVVAVRLPDGRWERQERHWCGCGGGLRWIEREGRQELRCPECDAEYALSTAGKLFAADETPFGLCLCGSCEHKRPLVRQGQSEVLVCPASNAVHVRPFDFPRQLRLLDQLQWGACSCCVEPQPLVRENEQVVCHRTRRPYRPAGRGPGFEPADTTAAPQAQVSNDVSSINRALLAGTLNLAESGLTAANEDDPDPDPEQ